ncbi:TIGR02678 family protein [Enterocloster citroniae]|uniref:TIGR02678 family protein n=1 Tax=Enterocloster citroniae TaxID=358743 RepID=UPI001D064315|nr:TIGR02678 family protein [Enterocloster citroniae]MCB7068090.1 TIGR02678 family protein [Enterocloster citroniae]
MENRTGQRTFGNRDDIEERRWICMNALLNRPWIERDTDPQLYFWTREQYLEIRNWFASYPGFSVIMNRRLIKLEKVPAEAKSWMGFEGFKEPIDYALFTYGLWYLEDKSVGDQFILTDMVKEIKEFMNEQGLDVDWKNYFHRLSMARALKKLKSLNVLHSIDGQEADWAADAERHDVLYECAPCASYVLRTFSKELSSYQRMEELSDWPEEEDKRKRQLLYRKYLLEPFVGMDVWEQDLFYFHGQKNHLIGQVDKMFGWTGTKYKEGVLFFSSELTGDMELFPTLLAISDLVLLFCGKIRELYELGEVKKESVSSGVIRLTRGKIEQVLLELQNENGERWTKEYRGMKSPQLAEAVCEHMEQWEFGRWEDDMFFLLYPLGGRYHIQYGEVEIEE